MTTLTVRALEARYGRIRAVRDAGLEAAEGEIVALIGANGAGKTTLLRCLAGLHRPSAGSIRIDGQEVAGVAAHKMTSYGLALVPEGRQLFGDLTVAENLRMGMYGTGIRSAAGVNERMEGIYEMFPVLRDFSGHRAGLMSGGQQQMLAIGRALIRRPRILLFDEPSLGLAPRIVTQILRSVQSLAATGVTVLLSEQNATAALRIADRGVVMENGRITRTAPAAELLADDDVSHHYLGRGQEETAPAGIRVLPENLDGGLLFARN
ncbi:MAG: livF [Actinoallomurus sp.]|nr:livF [Actinoallomurus sp.]